MASQRARPLKKWKFHPTLLSNAAAGYRASGKERVPSPQEALEVTSEWIQEVLDYNDGVQYYLDSDEF